MHTWRFFAIFFFLVLAILFPTLVFYQVLYLIFFATLGVGYAYARAINGLVVSVVPSTYRIFCGESAALTITVRNPSWFPIPWVKLEEVVPLALGYGKSLKRIMSLGPKESRAWTITLWSSRRGTYVVGPLQVKAGDAFGMTIRSWRIDPISMTVYPKIVSIGEISLRPRLPYSSIRAHTALFEDQAKPIGVRDYLPRDPVNRIHWKLSARAGNLQVKEYEPTTALESMVFLNLNEADYGLHYEETYSELAIEVAASLIVAMGRLRQAVGLGTNGDASTLRLPRREVGSLIEVLELLASCSLGASRDFIDLIREGAGQLPWGSTVLMVTPEDTLELIQTAIGLRRSGLEPVIIVVNRKLFNPEALASLKRMGIGAINIQTEEDLRAWGMTSLLPFRKNPAISVSRQRS